MSSVVQQRYEIVPIDSIKPHPKNPRKGNLEAIAESVEANGFYGAIVVQESSHFILAGTHRWLTLREQGDSEAPVIFIDVDDETAVRILLADNRVNDLAGYDEDLLAALLTELAEVEDLFGTGYEGDALDDLLSSQEVAQEVSDLPEPDSSYIEDIEEIQARASKTAVSKEAQGLREVILVYTQADHDKFVAAVTNLRTALGTESTSSTVLRALRGDE